MTAEECCAILARSGVAVGPDQKARLEEFVRRLLSWNERVNLVSRRDVANIWERHVLHCAAWLAVRPPARSASVVDIGTGGGLPGAVVAILRPDLGVTLVDSIEKKCSALRDVLRGLFPDAPPAVVRARAEDLATASAAKASYDAVLARGVAPLADLARYAEPLLRPGGALYAWKGGDLADELRALRRPVELLSLRLGAFDGFETDGKVIVSVQF
jgi:16S rRNA (guanine527-N7)-methyltransferase